MKIKISNKDGVIKREFGGLPVVDAKRDLLLFVSQSDIDFAKSKDPGHCIFANSCKRQFNSNKVMFLQGVAYVSLPDEKGDHHIERFILSSATKRLLKKFDKGEKVEPGGAFHLLAPTKGQTLNAERNRSRKDRKRKKDPKIKQVSPPQQGKVAKAFLNDPDLLMSARQIHRQMDFDWPLTSTRRALKNLEDASILVKTDERVRTSLHSTGENQYRLDSLSKNTIKSLLSTIKSTKQSIKSAKIFDADIRNGRGAVQAKSKVYE